MEHSGAPTPGVSADGSMVASEVIPRGPWVVGVARVLEVCSRGARGVRLSVVCEVSL